MIRAVLALALAGCAHQAAGPTPREHELEQQLAATQAELDKARAEKCTTSEDAAIKTAQEAVETVDKLARDLDDLAKKIDAAVDSVVAAQNDADRAAARAKLDELKRQRWEMEQRLEAAKKKK